MKLKLQFEFNKIKNEKKTCNNGLQFTHVVYVNKVRAPKFVKFDS